MAKRKVNNDGLSVRSLRKAVKTLKRLNLKSLGYPILVMCPYCLQSTLHACSANFDTPSPLASVEIEALRAHPTKPTGEKG